MKDVPLPENREILSADIQASFGNVTIETLKDLSVQRIQQLKESTQEFAPVRFSEEEEWLVAFVERDDPLDIIKRVPSGLLDPLLAQSFLPFMMTVETETRWELGRGVLDCSLYHLSLGKGYLVERIMGSNPQIINVVCRYVKFCALHFESFAIESWDGYWKQYSVD